MLSLFPSIKPRLVTAFLAVITTGFLSASPVQAQGTAALLSRFNPPNPGMGWGSRFLNSGMPGVGNPSSPAVAPPTFRGEARIRPIFLRMNGVLQDASTGASFDLRTDLGLNHQAIVVESMARTQFGRLGFRFHTDTYFRRFDGTQARLDWPAYRVGLDYDIIERSMFKVGLNADVNTESPSLEISHPSVPVSTMAFARPATWGAHVVVNPVDIGGLTASLEARGRRSLRTGTRLDEVDLSLGFKTPATMLGAMGLRGGWRYTEIAADSNNLTFSSKWSGFFADLVFLY
jgi:hypothetical protein